MYVAAIDQSTSATKAFLIDAKGKIAYKTSRSHEQYYPAPAFVEHDGAEIWCNTVECLRDLVKAADGETIAAFGISNQRETTAIWDRATGEPVCPFVVWQDVRAEGLCRELADADPDARELVHSVTGLTLSPYYPAAKAAAVLTANPDIRKRAEAGELCIGTVDSYLIFRLTGGKVFACDVSNGSRTSLMSLETLAWDERLCRLFGIPMQALPAQILPSDADFGAIDVEGLPPIPIRGVMGDSHAALFGQGCHETGMTKATYGTGSSVMMNVGEKPIISSRGLSASVGFGFNGRVCYVLEGNITCCGDTLVWLKEGLGILPDIADAERLASAVPSTEGVVFIPAFSGLGAPYFDGDARAAVTGINRGTKAAHIIRAALEAMAMQDADVLEVMEAESGRKVTALRTDGGPTRNALLMQMQADFADCGVECCAAPELSALGAGYMAGIAAGAFGADILNAREIAAVYAPAATREERQEARSRWKAAIGKALSQPDAQNV